MIRLAILLLLIVLPTISFALPSNIRAGEHDAFSRLVVDIEAGANWRIGRVIDGYAVEIEGASTFNFDEVFDRIPPTRIQSIRAASSETRFEILTDCECRISAFLWRPDKLVIDINDGMPDSESPHESAMDAPSAEATPKSIALPIVTARETAKEPQMEDDNRTANFAAIAADHAHLDALEEIVVQSLARGATQGLLTPSEQLDTTAYPRPPTQIEHIDAHFDDNSLLGLLAHTSIDLGSENMLEIEADAGKDCISDSYFDVGSWASGEGYTQDITPIRVALAKELDVVDFDEVTKLAKTLIFYGFGREAIAAMLLDHEMSQERLILAKIAAVIDGDPVDPDFLSNQGTCDNSSALWWFLANPENPKKPSNTNAILRSFRALPINLQDHLGPRLADMFTQMGDFDSAILVLSSGQPSDSTNTASKLAEADLMIGLGNVGEATASLADVVATDPRSTPESLTKFLNLSLSAGESVSESDLALADIMRFEYRGQPAIEELVLVQARILTEAGEIDRAIALLEEEKSSLSEEEAAELTSNVILKAVEVLPERKFLDLAFSKTVDDAQPKAQNTVAKKLLAFGLAERASVLVKGAANSSEMSERRYLRAEAALELNEAPLALSSLEGLSTIRANLLREQAILQDASGVGNGAIAVGDDWRQGNWTSLKQSTDDFLRSVSQSILDEAEPEQVDRLTLAISQGFIEKSEQSRSLIDDLLARYMPVTD